MLRAIHISRSFIRVLACAIMLAGVVPRAHADHYSGGSITYECLSGNNYLITLDLFLDCTGAPLTAQSLTFSNNCGVSFTLNNIPLVVSEEVSQLCPSQLANSSCSGGPLPGMFHYQFQTTLFLSPCNYWTMAWSICCRNTTQNVLATPGMYVAATLNNSGGLCDASPQFGDNTIPYVCVNQPVSYNPGVTDADGNTLVYSLISARYASPAPMPVNYDPGYSAAQPIPGISLDPGSGQINFTATVTGNYVVVIEVATYDVNGNLIGTVMRDFLFVVITCTDPPPVTDGLTNATNGLITSSTGIEVCDGEPFCVDVVFDDSDPGSVLTVTSQGMALLPGATLTVVGTNPATATFCWTPDPAFSPVSIVISASDVACPIPNVASTAIFITVVDPPPLPPDAGSGTSVATCPGFPNIDLFGELGGTPDPGGYWTDPLGIAHSGTFLTASDPYGAYVYSVGNGCQVATAVVTVSSNGGPDAGTNGSLTVCSNGAAVPLIGGLGGTPDAGGSWTGPSPVAGGNYNPATMAPGVYTYTVTATPPCADASATVTVTESAPPNAGTNALLTVCSTSASTSMFAQLGGSPQAGGIWSGPSPVAGGNYNPATMNPGVYTYTVTGTAPCANASATVTVTENAAANAGTNGTLTVCGNSASASLFAQLGGAPQAGGAWSGPSPVAGGNYDPATMSAGVYTYTITGAAPCANASATVTVTENAVANAGTNGTLTVCSTGATASLFAQLGGSPQAGGAWSGPSPVVGGNYDPATMTAGVYTYTVTGVAPCANANATVTVTENAAADAGSNGTLTVCSSGAAASLFAQLGGAPQAGGSWSGPSPVVGGNYDPATMTAGAYTYTVTGLAPCANAAATITVTENAAADAGINGTLTVCSDGIAVPLFAQLGGAPQPGGTWSGPSPVAGGNYDPATMNAGVYTYTLTGMAPCVDASATVTVTENAAATAGTDATLAICANGATTSLLAQLGGAPQAGGSWSGPSPVVGGNYDPATMTAGAYSYTVTGVAPCTNAIATVTVTEEIAVDAGTDAVLAICDDGAATSLFAELGGTPQGGGAWSGPSVVVGGNYDPATMTPGTYTYTVTGAAPCPDASASITVTENPAVDAGSDDALTICSNGATIDLFAQLGGSPDAGGTWSGPSPVTGNSYDPATMIAGIYTYTLVATAPCVGDGSTVTVTENTAADAGVDDALTICDQGAATSLFSALGGTPDAGGSWTGPSPVVGGNYDPATMVPGVYTYTVDGIDPCGNASADITVNETGSPTAGVDGSITVCSNGSASDLFAQLSGSPDAGGTWSGPSPVTGNSYDPATMTAGVYTYTLVATAPCVGDGSTVTVTESTAVDAGSDGSLTMCDAGAPTSLFAQLGGTPDAGGTWSGPSPVVGGNYDPATMIPGVYTYTVNGVAPCGNASAVITVNETSSPTAGVDGSITVCSNGTVMDLFAQLTGSPDAGGTWSGPSAVTGNSYDPATMIAGVYTYTLVATAPCVGDQSTVAVTESIAANAGTDNTLTICDLGAATSLFAQLGGTPDPGGNWSGPSPVVGGNYDPATMIPGVYTYSVIGVAPCANAAAEVTVNETSSPNAGTDGSITVCSNGSAIDLFAQLNGSPDAGGTWSGPSPVMGNNYDPATMIAGVYTYTLVATAPCVGDQSTVAVTESIAADAGTDNTLTICDQGTSVSLFSALGGAPDPGGSWSGPSPVIGGNYDPALMTPGAYIYAVTGVAPCGDASATITVNESSSPNAGTAGSITVCSNGPAIDLFAQLGGSPDAGGTWSGPSPLAGGNFDPATMSAGVYTYALNATAPCVPASASVEVAIETVPNAGSSGTLDLCVGAGVIDLLTVIGDAQAGGTWTGPSGGEFDGTFDPGSDVAGVHVYTITGVACPSASATATVNLFPGPDAGVDNLVSFCNTAAPFDLITQLNGTPEPGGTWTNSNGVPSGTTFDPTTMGSGTFTYTVEGSATCPDDNSVLTITVNIAPQAGASGDLVLCESSVPVSLFDGLSGTLDAGGTWTDPSNLAHASIFDPAIDGPGTYTYTVAGVVPCVSAVSTVSVEEYPVPDAGESGSAIYCSTNAPVALLSVLGGTPQPDGIWQGPGDSPCNGTFAPGSNVPGDYTYTITGVAPCGSDQAVVTISVNAAANAGTGATISLCADDPEVDLFPLLGGTPDATGIWTAPDGTATDAVFDPATDAPGAYVYSVIPLAPCATATATVVVTVIPLPTAEILAVSDGSCAPAEVTLSSGYTGPGSCTWILGNGEVVQDCGPITATYAEPGSYDVTLTIDAGNGCGSETFIAEDAVNVHTQPVAGFDILPGFINTMDPVAFLSNTSVGATAYEWDIAGLATSTDVDVRYEFPAELGDEYPVCLVAIASSNCTDTICKVITVDEGMNVSVPNSFTPDGNGVNDTFKPVALGIDTRFYNFQVYDRWGVLIFSTEDPEAFWDGRQDGSEAPVDVYVWKLMVKDAYSGERADRIGHVSLLR